MMAPVQFVPQPQFPQPIPQMPVQNVAAEPPPRPRIRLQAPEEPARVPPRNLTLPPPDKFGLTSQMAKPTVDWNVTRARLQQLGATNYRVDYLGADGFRVRLLLNGRAGSMHEIETTAGTDAAALAVALEQAEQWKKTK